MAADEAGGQAKLVPKRAHFVLEEFAQRFDQFQTHLLRQTADVVVAFDRNARPAAEGHALDHVRIKRALGEEIGIVDLTRVFLEHVDEKLADGLALLLGVRDALELAKEQIAFIRMDQLHVVMVAEHRDHFLGLVEAEQAVIHEHAGQLVANRLVQQNRRHGRVDAAGEAADHMGRADLFADLGDGFFAVSAHRPVTLETGVANEVLIERLAVRGVMHLRVELHGVEPALQIGGDREGGVGRGAVDLEARRDLGHVVAVAHPHLLAPRAVHEPAVERIDPLFGRGHVGAAEFGGAVTAQNLAAQHVHHDLLAVTDAEDRNPEVENAFRGARRAVVDHAGRTARKDHGFRRELFQERIGHVLIGVNFAIDVQLPQAARDQLRHLAAEVDDEKALMIALRVRDAHGPSKYAPRHRRASAHPPQSTRTPGTLMP